jgi:hypothetical protein
MVVEGFAFSHSDSISITRYYPINGPIIYKGHGYDEELAASLHGYPLAEIVAEKMRITSDATETAGARMESPTSA